jgi:hypothetical protein
VNNFHNTFHRLYNKKGVLSKCANIDSINKVLSAVLYSISFTKRKRQTRGAKEIKKFSNIAAHFLLRLSLGKFTRIAQMIPHLIENPFQQFLSNKILF